MAEKKEKKSFVWQSLRVSFWVMVGLWVISTIASVINPNLSYDSALWAVIGIIWMVSVFFTFVVSIIHLGKYKEKALPITALVISSILILLILFGVLLSLSGVPGY